MNILAVDQARHGAWAVFDYEKKALLDYGTWSYDNKNYERIGRVFDISGKGTGEKYLRDCFCIKSLSGDYTEILYKV